MNIFSTEYSVITFATNKTKYLDFAFNCARSILLRNNIKIYIATNLTKPIPKDLESNVSYVQIKEEHAKLGIGAKLYIDRYVQTRYSLFIDSDCLVYDTLQPIFSEFKGQSVSVIGFITEAERFCGKKQANTIKNVFNILNLIRFNGGVYYIEKNELAENIFEFARNIIPDYDKLGFQRINGNSINEEGLLSISMVKHRQIPIPDTGKYMTDLYTDPNTTRLNVLSGNRVLNNPSFGEFRHRSWYIDSNLSPIIVHFGGATVYTNPYLSQHIILIMYSKGIPKPVINTVLIILIIIQKIKNWATTFLRKLKINLLK